MIFWMLMWEAASMCELPGHENEKAIAIKLIFLIVFFVLPKLYEKIYKLPLLWSARLE